MAYRPLPEDLAFETEWAISPISAVGLSAGVGGSVNLYDLVNRRTHRAHLFLVTAATYGLNLKLGNVSKYADHINNAASPLSDAPYTNFTSLFLVNFETFDRCAVMYGTAKKVIHESQWMLIGEKLGIPAFSGLPMIGRPIGEVNMSSWGLVFPGVETGQSLDCSVIYGRGHAKGVPDYLIPEVPDRREDPEIHSYIVERDNRIVMQFPGNVLFKFDDAKIMDVSLPLLAKTAKFVSEKRVSHPRVYIVGYTDSMGGEAYNQSLSEHRAQAVFDHLTRITPGWNTGSGSWTVVGRGRRNPTAPNTIGGHDHAYGRALNRRVDILLLQENSPLPIM